MRLIRTWHCLILFFVNGSWAGLWSQTSVANESESVELHHDSLTLEVVRVRSMDTSIPVDTLWDEAVWNWTGNCLDERVSFRFDWGDSVYRSQTFPCEKLILLHAESASTSAPTTALTYANQANDVHVANISLTREQLDSTPHQLTASACYPPSSDQSVADIAADINDAVFESDKCALLEEWVSGKCLTYSQASLLLLLIPSEDRRLEALESGFLHLPIWSEESAAALFHLSFLKTRARQSVASEKQRH